MSINRTKCEKNANNFWIRPKTPLFMIPQNNSEFKVFSLYYNKSALAYCFGPQCRYANMIFSHIFIVGRGIDFLPNLAGSTPISPFPSSSPLSFPFHYSPPVSFLSSVSLSIPLPSPSPVLPSLIPFFTTTLRIHS